MCKFNYNFAKLQADLVIMKHLSIEISKQIVAIEHQYCSNAQCSKEKCLKEVGRLLKRLLDHYICVC